MRKIILINIFLTFCFTIFSQQATIQQKQLLGITKDQLDAVKKRKLAVIIPAPEKERMERLQKKEPERAEQYKKYMDDLNAWVKEIVAQYWPYNKNIEYITEEKAMELYKAENTDYVALGFVGNVNVTIGNTYYQSDDLGNQKQNLGVHYVKMEKWEYSAGNTKMFIKPVEKLAYSTTNFEVPMGNVVPQKSDVISGMQCLLLMFENGSLLSELKGNKETIKTKTLLLNKVWLSSKLDNEAIKIAYPNAYQVVDQAEYDKLIASKDTKYCYLTSLPHLWNKSKKGAASNTFELRYMSVVIDLATGKLLYFRDDDAGIFDTSRIKKKVLKDIAE